MEGEQLGVVSLSEALAKAEEADIDLVEIAPTAEPPVCRLMDYGKFKYAESKRQHEQKLKQKQVQVKEIKFRPGTDEGDYQIKVRNITKFIKDGDKAKVTLRFRGREITHQELGMALLKRVEEELKEFYLKNGVSINKPEQKPVEPQTQNVPEPKQQPQGQSQGQPQGQNVPENGQEEKLTEHSSGFLNWIYNIYG